MLPERRASEKNKQDTKWVTEVGHERPRESKLCVLPATQKTKGLLLISWLWRKAQGSTVQSWARVQAPCVTRASFLTCPLPSRVPRTQQRGEERSLQVYELPSQDSDAM